MTGDDGQQVMAVYHLAICKIWYEMFVVKTGIP
jgi:hypothetical protein